MANDIQRIELPGHVQVRLESRSGKVRLHCEPRPDLAIEDDSSRRVSVTIEGNQVTVNGPKSGSLVLRCPEGTDFVIGTLSASVEVSGRAGSVVVSTASGTIKVDEALSTDLRSMSGSISAGRVAGEFRAKSAAGSASAAHAGQADVATVSGSIHLPDVAGKVRARSVSGRVDLACDGCEAVSVHTVSGGVIIRLPESTRPNPRIRTASGTSRCDLAVGDDCEIACSSVSGHIELVSRG